ncbi:anthranilate phosphoribosyltransferase [Thalassoporum mexicanum PCC 7367]|uniref:anthranilate phosphoribosyltransferase n=1 Tax=Thalassoporum mexicanum TaxID=3457544 RepID=UPI00029FD583|nr:anthranilate phosphoribosyltransferase [Pseudanabaena sp. PCC 7367]AFY69585.1 anthranilate phosphoribosyltransferase [Pseudanabaena sp. PCC 7367]
MTEYNWSALLQQLIDRQSLSAEQATQLMEGWLAGAIAPEISGGILTALQCKSVDAVELAAMANVLQRSSLGQSMSTGNLPMLLDTCGTGGDGKSTFNISTAVAFVAAAAGVPVAKHGNRAVSSKSGSADVLEALGIKLNSPTEKIHAAIAEVGITFLFAPSWHPAMKAVVPIRKALKIRTIFNLIGPLVNPLLPTAQVLGVYNQELIAIVAEALKIMGRQQAVVLHSREGLDEAGLGDLTDLAIVEGDKVELSTIASAEVGLASAPIEALQGGDVAANAEILRSLLQGKGTKAQRDCVALNAGIALRITGQSASWQAGANQAGEIIDSGAAWQKLTELVDFLSN